MDKRYQVFVSSTYEDLREERQEVMQALLELDCIPSGMELFPAANDDQWTIIKKVIDDCDYYIVVSAGRYGSLGPNGKSYTQMEYEYAVAAGKPIIGFLHYDLSEISAAKTEKDEDGRAALEKFRTLIKQKGVRTFKTPGELGSVVSRSIIKLVKTHPATGWIRADAISNEMSAIEILRLRRENEDIKAKLANQGQTGPIGAEELAQGNEVFAISFDITYLNAKKTNMTWQRIAKFSWNSLCKTILPLTIIGATETAVAAAIETKSFDQVFASVKRTEKGLTKLVLSIDEDSLRTILIQLEALGLISKTLDGASQFQWKITPYGQAQMVRLYAIKKKPTAIVPTSNAALQSV
jgi:hypothetical protein